MNISLTNWSAYSSPFRGVLLHVPILVKGSRDRRYSSLHVATYFSYVIISTRTGGNGERKKEKKKELSAEQESKKEKTFY